MTYKVGDQVYVKPIIELYQIRGVQDGYPDEPCGRDRSMFQRCGRCCKVVYTYGTGDESRYQLRPNGTNNYFYISFKSLNPASQQLQLPETLEGFRNLLYIK